MRTIEVDTDVFAAIWARRNTGEESENEILRRVLASTPTDDTEGIRERLSNGTAITSKIPPHVEKAMKLSGSKWLEEIYIAMKNLGGEARYADLYPAVKKERRKHGLSLTDEWQATVRRTIEDHSSDSMNFRGSDIFRKVSRGRWAIRQ